MRSKTVYTDLWSLTKPGITRLVLITAGVGFYLGASGSLDLVLMFQYRPCYRSEAGPMGRALTSSERDEARRMATDLGLL